MVVSTIIHKEDVMRSIQLSDRAGRRRLPATTSSFHRGVPPRNKGLRYPPDPPSVEEIIAVMRAAGDGPDGVRLRGVIVVLWRAGLRISEALALNETDLDPDRGALLIRHGKGDKRREVGMDRWAWSHLERWLELRSRRAVLRRTRANMRSAVRNQRASATPPSRPGSVAGSHRINCDTRMR
jgi:integrase